MIYFTCTCKWSFIIGKKNVYGPIFRLGLAPYPQAYSQSQRMMGIEDFKDNYGDCWNYYKRIYSHDPPRTVETTGKTKHTQ